MTNHFPILKTERLLLRNTNLEDIESIFYLRTDPLVNQFIKRSRPKNMDDSITFIEQSKHRFTNKELIYWAITLKSSFKMIGSICLWNFSEDRKEAELGYDLFPTFHKKGIMKEAFLSVLSYGFNDLGINKIFAYTHKHNEPSIGLLTRFGFTLCANEIDEKNLDNQIYLLKDSEFKTFK